MTWIHELSDDVFRCIYQQWVYHTDAVQWQLAHCVEDASMLDPAAYEDYLKRVRHCPSNIIRKMRMWTKPFLQQGISWWYLFEDDAHICGLYEIMHIEPPYVNNEIYTHQGLYPWICTHTRRLDVVFRTFLKFCWGPVPSVTEFVLQPCFMETPSQYSLGFQWPKVTKLVITDDRWCDFITPMIFVYLPNIVELHIQCYSRPPMYLPESILYQLQILTLAYPTDLTCPPIVKPLSLHTLTLTRHDDALNQDIILQIMQHSPQLHTFHATTTKLDIMMRYAHPNVRVLSTHMIDIASWISHFPNLEVFIIYNFHARYPIETPLPPRLHTVKFMVNDYDWPTAIIDHRARVHNSIFPGKSLDHIHVFVESM